MNKKKVLFMLSSMNIGGVEKSLLSLLAEIPKDQYDITVLLLEKKGGFLSYIPDWVNVDETPWFQEVKPLIMQPPQKTVKEYIEKGNFFKMLFFIFEYFISKYFNRRSIFYKNVTRNIPINENLYDIAISYQGPTDIIDYYVVNKVIAREKISWIHFDVSNHKVNKKLYESLFKKFNKIYVVSNEAKERLVEVFPSIKNKARVFMNFIPTNLIKQMSAESIKLDENFKGVKIVTVGRLSYEKGQDIAIKVLFKLKKDGFNVRWYCIGEGNNRKEYEAMIKDYDLETDFLLLGTKPNPYPYIEKADIYVQTSRHEGYCLSLAEAKCLDKPIVSTNFIGAYEQLIHGYNGLIVECNEDDLYKELKKLIEYPEQKKQLVKNLKKSKFSEIHNQQNKRNPAN